MNIEIDKGSGFCFGVVFAIQKAEEELATSPTLYCLGDIVHNTVEVKRLKDKGLITINHEEFKKLKNCKVLLRAHGEPPETYLIAKENNIELVDATCPVVLKLQHRIKTGYEALKDIDGQLVIYGKHGHAEVNGLVGQTDGKAIVIGSREDLDRIDYSKPVTIFSQTTKSLESFESISQEIKRRMMEAQRTDNVNFIFNDTICRQVYNRYKKLKTFANAHDVIIFVTDPKSSNGKVLYDICKTQNVNSYLVAEKEELQRTWFESANSVGICGATSTPRWLMEEISTEIGKISH
jgi:4-hydroxy-3-methylbut-2-en-1-yl diphosphate reductase